MDQARSKAVKSLIVKEELILVTPQQSPLNQNHSRFVITTLNGVCTVQLEVHGPCLLKYTLIPTCIKVSIHHMQLRLVTT